MTHDALLAIGSLIFVYLCMIVHTRSPIVATVAMAQVLASVPIGVYLHRALFRVDQFYVLNFLGLFIIAGIGADEAETIRALRPKRTLLAWQQSLLARGLRCNICNLWPDSTAQKYARGFSVVYQRQLSGL